ncbi:MAG TPA: hypothetical protein VG777_04720 [Thermoanaerobaculia bacterium]|nr:hypothetical protein [Thermoanaerobaculia bacterium]
MKARLLAIVLAAALAAPAAARPAVAVPHRPAAISRIWSGFLGLFSRLFEVPSQDEHALPPPTCSTSLAGQ